MATEAWQEVAERFRSAAERRDPTAKLARDQSLRLLGTVDGKRVLELGSGCGELCLLLARRGAQVVGMDGSLAELREAARISLESGVEPRPSFVVGRPADAGSWPLERFDRVIAIRAFATEGLTREIWRGMAERLAPGGVAVLALEHPYARGRRADAPLEKLLEGVSAAALRLRELREPGSREPDTSLLLLALERARARRRA